MMLNKESWVSKWNNLQKCTPGVYAIDVKSEIKLVKELKKSESREGS